MQPFMLDLGFGERIVGDLHKGRPPSYLFLHGLGSVRIGEKSNSLLDHAVSNDRGFLRIDLRGHGESTGRLGGVAVSELIADTVAVLERMASERLGPTVVVG
ncbi:MAG: alpha/beta hydrolase, partial [Planctomycetota bacterium]